MAPPPALASGPIYFTKKTMMERIILTIRVYAFSTLTKIFIPILTSRYIRGKAYMPTLTKTYPSQPTLTHRVFIPPSYKSGDAPLPLYLNIHGGGFAIGSPAMDDMFCSHFSKTHNILVISLDYPKAPAHPFPSASNSLIATIDEILTDPSLPINTSKVAIGGFSAGGNLSLCVPQSPSLQGKIHGIVAFYPVVNFVTPNSVSIAARPANAPKDPLKDMSKMFNFAYLPVGQDLCDPMLSPAYAERKALPGKICIVGCELDMLCYDAEFMAERLAGKERVEGEWEWEKGGVRWEKIKGAMHGFESMDGKQPNNPTPLAERMEIGRKMWDDAAKWLFREVYK